MSTVALPVVDQIGHDAALVVFGVEQSDRNPMTTAGGDLLFLSDEYLGAVVRRRA
jgi:hypothetical protein